MMRNVKLIIMLALVGQAHAGVEDWPLVGSVHGVLESPAEWPLKPTASLKGTLNVHGDIHESRLIRGDIHANGELESTAEGELPSEMSISKPVGSMSLEKKMGNLCCAVKSSADWPPKPTVSIHGAWDRDMGTIRGEMESPAVWPLEATGSISLEKKIDTDIGALCGEVKCTGHPEGHSETIGTLTLDKEIEGFCCSLESTANLADIKADFTPKTIASIVRTVDTSFGPVRGRVESNAEWPLKPTGSISMKKKIGNMCYKLEASSPGTLRCTVESGDLQLTGAGTEALLAQKSPTIIGIQAVALIGVFVSSGIAFAALRFRRSMLTMGGEPLLSA